MFRIGRHFLCDGEIGAGPGATVCGAASVYTNDLTPYGAYCLDLALLIGRACRQDASREEEENSGNR
jgi:hypothetical protein